MAIPVDQEEWGGYLSTIFSLDSIHHACGLNHQVEPKGARHLFLGRVGAQHMDHYLPMQLYTMGRLATSGHGNDVRGTVNEVLANLCPEKFHVTI
jgi:hypothetical protein